MREGTMFVKNTRPVLSQGNRAMQRRVFDYTDLKTLRLTNFWHSLESETHVK